MWSRWFEPYVVGFTEEIPKYNENLVGRYENKALHIAEMRAKGQVNEDDDDDDDDNNNNDNKGDDTVDCHKMARY